MTITLHLDTEQAALLDAALDFAQVALESRAARIDPDRVLSDSAKLQSLKVKQVRAQFDAPASADWAQMDKEERAQIDGIFKAWPSLQSDTERQAALEGLNTICDECRIRQKRPKDAGNPRKSNLRDQTMEKSKG